jgi:hypothetical protein
MAVPFSLLSSNANKGGYDTGLVGVVQGQLNARQTSVFPPL